MEKKIAEWMNRDLRKDGTLYQEVVVYAIKDKFGEKYIYYNNNYNPAISKKVLAEFRKLTPDAKWSKGGRFWFIDNGNDWGEGRQVY